MIIHPGFIGIDVSKHHLDIFNATTQHVERIDNTAQAIISTFELLQADPIKLIVFEATGSYDGSLRSALTSLQLPFVRVNPARARDFAKSIGLLAKTDAIDARMLAAMAQCLNLQADPADDPHRQQLALLHKRRDQFVATRKQELTRLAQADMAQIRDSLLDHLAWLEAAIASLDQHISLLIARHDSLEQRRRLMCSTPGIGRVISTTLLALLPELGQRSSKTIAALAGLAPFNRDSGLMRGSRQIRGGRRRVRQALYMAAVSASRSKSLFAETYRALRQAGKPPKLALIALARKILVTLNAIVRDQVTFKA